TGIDASTGRSGTATGRVRFVGQHATLNVVMLGRGTIRGRVTYDFGRVPAGRGEISTFENQTGQSGVQVFFTIHPDQVNQVNLTMRDQRGVVQGFVYRKVNGSDVPMFG